MQLFSGDFSHIKDPSQPNTIFRYCVIFKNVGEHDLPIWERITQSHRALATHVVDWLDENATNPVGEARWFCPPFDAKQITFRGTGVFFKTASHAKAFIREFAEREPNVRIPSIKDSTYSSLDFMMV